MDKIGDVSRRAALSAPAAMLLATGASACAAEDQQVMGDGEGKVGHGEPLSANGQVQTGWNNLQWKY